MNKDYFNASGLPDPTAFEAMQHINAEERQLAADRVNRLIKQLKAIIGENGFTLEKRIELRDTRTGILFK
jgi:hypothetical protein